MNVAVFYLLSLMIISPNKATKIGAIVDTSSRIGQELSVAIEMAADDFNEHSNHTLHLLINNSSTDPLHAALAAMELMNSNVEAILGPQTWEQTSLVANVVDRKQTPILSFSDTIPNWGFEKYPFLIKASPNQYQSELKAIAAIIKSYEWKQVSFIYQDMDSHIVPDLFRVFQDIGVEIKQLLPLPYGNSSTLVDHLNTLRNNQCRVFIVHLSLSLAETFFEHAKNMSMMEKDYVWIGTNSFASLVHSIPGWRISCSMEGIIGVRSYYRSQDFFSRFRTRFASRFPDQENHEPGFLAAKVYDIVRSLASVLSQNKSINQLDGLVGNNVTLYEIINLTGRSYRQVGFWTDGLGFSKSVDDNYNSSMKSLGNVLWPGGRSWSTPRGWSIPTQTKPLRIAVNVRSMFKSYVNFKFDEFGNVSSFGGFSIDIFKAIQSELPFHLEYEYHSFNGSYTDMTRAVNSKKFDGAIGDIAIVRERCEYVEFTQPYTEAGLAMIVAVETSSNKALLFLKPFTITLWIIILITTIYNGFTIWLIERNQRVRLQIQDSSANGNFLWISFNSLFTLQGGVLSSNLSRMAMIVWLFVALVITQTYTAKLASMLTVQGLKPKIDNIHTLLATNAIVGHSNASYAATFLVDVLDFKAQNLRGYTNLKDYAKDLKSGAISAIFMEAALSKVFLARYCRSFTSAGPTYKVGGLGFAFEKGSPLVPMITESLLKVSESGKLRELEKSMLASETCLEVNGESEETSRLSPGSFWVLFVFSGGTSTIALMIYLTRQINVRQSMWILVLAFIRQYGTQTLRLYGRLLTLPGDTTPPTTSAQPSGTANV